MVSHDRDFLNEVADGILHLEHGKLTFYRGDYDNFQRTRRERLAHVQALAARQEVEREPMAPPLIALDHAAVGYDGPPVLQRLDLRVDPDDRIALLGANGNGKSTLVRLLAGQLKPRSGGRHASSKLRVGYFAQHQLDALDPAETAYQHMQRLMPAARVDQVRARLGRFGFGQARADVKAGNLSGGEKARLTLALITHDAPHMLVLDEPTNHLDIEAREALIDGLADYGGAVILVTHDRHMVELIADRLWLVADGTAKPFDGDIDDYRKLIASAAREAPARPRAAKPAPDKPPVSKQAATKSPAPPPPASKPTGPRPPLNALRRAARDAETRVASLTAEKEQ